MKRAETINRAFNGLPLTLLSAAALVAAAALSQPLPGSASDAGRGLCFSTASLRVDDPAASAALSCAALLCAGLLMYLLNKTYSFVRSMTMVYASSLLLLEAACPQVSATLTDGTLICLLILGTAFILFGSYGAPRGEKSVFITFAAISFASMFQVACLYLVAVYFVGFVQMRVMSARAAVAALLGLVLPYWIAFGFGLLPLESVAFPQTAGAPEPPVATMVWTVALTAVTIILMAINLVRIYGYKMQIRAYNGFFIILAVATMIAMAVDRANALNYLAVMHLCLAYQVAHCYASSAARYRFVALLALIVACAAGFFAQSFGGSAAEAARSFLSMPS